MKKMKKNVFPNIVSKYEVQKLFLTIPNSQSYNKPRLMIGRKCEDKLWRNQLAK